MVGDGVNDAPAWPAPRSASPSGPARMCNESAGVVLASDDPWAILSMIEPWRQLPQDDLVVNLTWASGLQHLVRAPGRRCVRSLPSSGILLPAAAVLMSLSTIVVALNAQLLLSIDSTSPPGSHQSGRRNTPRLLRIHCRPPIHHLGHSTATITAETPKSTMATTEVD